MKQPSAPLQRILRQFHAWGLGLRLMLMVIVWIADYAYLIRFVGVSAAVYVVGILLVRTGRWNLLNVLLAFEWLFFVRTWFVYFGWQCGFSLHYAALPLFTLLLDHFTLRMRVFLAVLPMALFLPLLTLVPPIPPVVELDPFWQKFLLGVNSGLFLLLASAIVLHALRSVVREKRRAEALAESRSRLIANMSHELKTPLAAMMTRLQATLLREREPERYRETLDVLERNTRSLGQLVRRMLDFVSAEDVALRPERRSVDLRDLLATCLADLKSLEEHQNVALELDAPAAPQIESDPDLLGIVFRNLVANAIRYSPEGRSVRITVGSNGQAVPVVTVRDEGPGIPAHVLPHIFDPFYRGDAARSRESGNFGLGLAIVAEYTAMLGYRVNVDTVPGRGTAFVVTLG